MTNPSSGTETKPQAPVTPGKGPNTLSQSAHRRLAIENFLWVTAQASLLVFIIHRYNLESAPFRSLMLLVVAGFLVHHFLPIKLKMHFFLGLSLVGTGYVLGLDASGFNLSVCIERLAILLGLGGVLIGVCHLPIRWSVRVGLLLLIGGVLAVLRGGMVQLPALDGVFPILASMFMFRLMIYVYDIRHEPQPQLSRAFAYFFALPNVCFPLFPVIDYANFKSNYFKGDLFAGYQKGLDWMLRGIFHLLLWRLIYYHVYLDPSRISDGTDVARYLFANMGLYLRVSGQFHLVIGMLHLFGFFLPQTNRNYFLAEGVNDYWRRVNIYWKDFMLKIFYMPAAFVLKSLGPQISVVLATVYAFVWTWFLHSYQWFWLRSEFTMKWQDVFFWGILGVAVVINSIAELKPRTQAKTGMARAIESSVRMLLTFTFITLVWGIWNVDNWGQVVAICKLADWTTAGWVVLVFALLVVSKLTLEGDPKKQSGGGKLSALKKKQEIVKLRPRALYVATVAAALVLFSKGDVRALFGDTVATYSASLFNTKPPKVDQEFVVRGYYEDLMDVSRADTVLNDAFNKQPRDQVQLTNSPAMRDTLDLRTRELLPNTDMVINGQRFQTNEFAFRDKSYPLARPSNTCRVAVLGTSFAMGWGVSNGESYFDLIEDKLNAEGRSGTFARFEFLNFAVNALGTFSQLEFLKGDGVSKFHPQVVLLSGYQADTYLTGLTFERAIRQEVDLRYPYLKELAVRSGVTKSTPPAQAAKLLNPFKEELTLWGMQQVADRAREIGAVPVYLYQDDTQTENADASLRERLLEGAKQAGYKVFFLPKAFGDRTDKENLIVAPWDHHPNKAGHAVIAERLHAYLTGGEVAAFLDNCWQN